MGSRSCGSSSGSSSSGSSSSSCKKLQAVGSLNRKPWTLIQITGFEASSQGLLKGASINSITWSPPSKIQMEHTSLTKDAVPAILKRSCKPKTDGS